MALFRSNWTPSIEEFIYPLKEFQFIPVDFNAFSKGIDNVHTDIELSLKLTTATFNLIQQITKDDVLRHLWHEEKKTSFKWNIDRFTALYKELIETTIHRIHQNAEERDTLKLLYIALYRLIIISFNTSFQHLRMQLKEANPVQTGKNLQLHDRAVKLAKGESAVQYRVIKTVVDLLHHYEYGNLRNIRQSLLHQPWVLNPERLFNPIIYLGNIQQNENLRHHYPLALSDITFFQNIGITFYNLFRHWLPALTKPIPQNRPANWTIQKNRIDQGVISGYLKIEIYLDKLIQEDEYKSNTMSWIDYPANISLILGGTDPEYIDKGPWDEPHWGDFQKRKLDDLRAILQKQNLLQPIWASYKTNELHNNLGTIIPIYFVYDYLSGRSNKKTLIRQIESINGLYNPEATIQQIDTALKTFKSLSKDEIRVLMVTFLQDFLTFRRDLKLAWHFYREMDQVRILTDEKEIELSIANHHLYQFKLGEEQQNEKRLRNHCVLKADLRGSTGVTATMREKNLNPASYFSKNFFDPINAILDTYDAKKVFIEGDALILANYNYAEVGGGLAIARSCGLAIEMIKIVRKKAIENRRHDLPPLELGIGIVFADEPPTFLNDDGHQIMISPAINWADRLSGCHADLKNKKYGIGSEGQGVYMRYRKSQLQRYNVNGIILDNPAFHYLMNEIKLKGFSLKSGSGRSVNYFYIGQYPDIKNKMRWLFIRKGKVSGRQIPEDIETEYYEVISDPSVIHKVKATLSKKIKH